MTKPRLLASALFSGALSAACLQTAVALAEVGSGFYTVRQEDGGVWWFVRPSGERFVSLGVCDIVPGPPRDEYDPADPQYAADLYYEDRAAWARDVHTRLHAWGFNTLGGWADPALVEGERGDRRLPETRVLHWGKPLGMPWCDVLGEEFARNIADLAEREVLPHRDDPNLLGWFTDNENPWYGDTMFMEHLGSDHDTATRGKLIALLREHYEADFDSTRGDFDVGDATTFHEMGRRGPVRVRPEGNGYDVVRRFTHLVAARYYKTVHDAIRRHDRNHLILGDRYMSYCPPAVARAAGPYVDVISTNFDWPDWKAGDFPMSYLRMLHAESGRPVIVSEWYVAARENRSGNRNRGEYFTKVETQAQRAATAEKRLENLMREPYVVGAHWFRYADEPTNGRPTDGEDFNFGLVDIRNRPYDRLVAAMTRANRQAAIAHGSSGESPATPLPVHRRPRAESFPACVESFTVVETDDETPLADLRIAWDDEQLYLGLTGFRFLEQRLLDGQRTPPQLDHRLRVEIGGGRHEKTLSIDANDPALLRTQHGVRFSYLEREPADRFADNGRLRAGQRWPLTVTLEDPVGGSTTWRTQIVLDATQPPDEETVRVSESNRGRRRIDRVSPTASRTRDASL